MRCYSIKFALTLGIFLFLAATAAQAQSVQDTYFNGNLTQTQYLLPAATPTLVEQTIAPQAAPCPTPCAPPVCVRKVKNVTYEDCLLPAKVHRTKQVSYVDCPKTRCRRVKQVSYLECPYTKVHRIKQVSYVECPETCVRRKRQVTWLDCPETVVERHRQVSYVECASPPKVKRVKHVTWTECAEPLPVCQPICTPVVNTCLPCDGALVLPTSSDSTWYSNY